MPVNIHMVLHQAMRMAGLFPQPPEGLVVLQDFDPSLPDVVGDAGALERTFLNLIKNAAEAIGESGTIRLHTRIEREFRMSAEGRRRQFLRVEISDSGVGIPEDQLSQLFTPFFTTKPAGTGLGLVLCQRIIALHGGRLWAQRGGVDRVKGTVTGIQWDDVQSNAPDDASGKTPALRIRFSAAASPLPVWERFEGEGPVLERDYFRTRLNILSPEVASPPS